MKKTKKDEFAYPKMEDAQKQHRRYPKTFYAPKPLELSEILKNSVPKFTNMAELPKDGKVEFKVCVTFEAGEDEPSGERFWVKVLAWDKDFCYGVVDNDLLFTMKHGLKWKDRIKFKLQNVYNFQT